MTNKGTGDITPPLYYGQGPGLGRSMPFTDETIIHYWQAGEFTEFFSEQAGLVITALYLL